MLEKFHRELYQVWFLFGILPERTHSDEKVAIYNQFINESIKKNIHPHAILGF